jgi:hypothetical protein
MSGAQDCTDKLRQLAEGGSGNPRKAAAKVVSDFAHSASKGDVRQLRVRLEDTLLAGKWTTVPLACLDQHSRWLRVLEGAGAKRPKGANDQLDAASNPGRPVVRRCSNASALRSRSSATASKTRSSSWPPVVGMLANRLYSSAFRRNSALCGIDRLPRRWFKQPSYRGWGRLRKLPQGNVL